MTNRERMIGLLSNPDLTNTGTEYESMVFHNIRCPYIHHDDRAKCNYNDDVGRALCTACRMEWLEDDAATRPADRSRRKETITIRRADAQEFLEMLERDAETADRSRGHLMLTTAQIIRNIAEDFKSFCKLEG